MLIGYGMWGARGSSFYERTSHTYTFRLGENKISILYQKMKKKKKKSNNDITMSVF